MKNYKENKVLLGGSDIASLIMVGPPVNGSDLNLKELHFGIDGAYSAWVVEDKSLIPEHYNMVAEFAGWLKVYDDEGLTFKTRGKKIEIYRAGEMGALIYVQKKEA